MNYCQDIAMSLSIYEQPGYLVIPYKYLVIHMYLVIPY